MSEMTEIDHTAATAMPDKIFIVGASRSGTTMMCRIVGNNQKVHFFRELHFFEHAWTPEIPPAKITREEAGAMARRLIGIQREGFLKIRDASKYDVEAQEMVDDLEDRSLTPDRIYSEFLRREAEASGASVAVEQTPAYALYIKELLELFPEARFVHMIRDPRAVLSSQRSKWRRRIYDKTGSGFTWFETLRAWTNYHPWTTAKLWKAAVASVAAVGNHPRVKTVSFESLADDPNAVISDLCGFLNLAFEPEMLLVPKKGSSFSVGGGTLGIDSSIARSSWRSTLPRADISICESVCGDLMSQFGYQRAEQRSVGLGIALAYLALPIKLALAVLLNLGRTKNLLSSMRKRMRAPAPRRGD